MSDRAGVTRKSWPAGVGDIGRPAPGGVRVAAVLPGRDFDAHVDLAPGAITAIVGPNGAGKSTLLGLISGLLRPASGTVTIDGTTVAAPDSFTPPHRRPVAVLDQRPLLFPHLDVLDNVAFGVRSRGASRAAARARALAELESIGAADFAGRRPSALSGGEAQRVALARALATDPAVVLLDEPFSSLDVTTAATLRRVLAERLRGATAPAETAQNRPPDAPDSPESRRISNLVPSFAQPRASTRPTIALVTHDPLDVWALADQVVALESGRLSAQGAVEDLLGRPPTRFLAELSGMNLIAGTARPSAPGPTTDPTSGPTTDPTGAGAVPDLAVQAGDVTLVGLWDATRPTTPGQHALATFAPAAVALYPEPPHGSPRNTWPVEVTTLDARGATVRVHLRLGDGQPLSADLTAQGAAALGVSPGQRLAAQVKATQVTLYGR